MADRLAVRPECAIATLATDQQACLAGLGEHQDCLGALAEIASLGLRRV
jgi:hypothetical protein